jgi:periplasmic protein TonB
MLISKVDPEYTKEACEAKQEGTVVLRAVVKTDGTPGDIEVAKSLGYGLDEKAVEAFKKWRFKPGTKDGKAVDISAAVEIHFRILKDTCPR